MEAPTTSHALITFDPAWMQREKLLLLVAFSLFGCLMNGFYILSFSFNEDLKRYGFLFKASLGIADAIVTMVVVPLSAVLLLSGRGDSEPELCYGLQFLTTAATYDYSIFFAMMSLETYFRVARSTEDYLAFLSKPLETITILVLLATFSTAAIGVYLGLDYDFCYLSHSGNFAFRTATNVIFHIIPFVITIFCSISAFLMIKYRANTDTRYRWSSLYRNDRSAHYVNVLAYILYVGAWLPCLILTNLYPYTDSYIYWSVWLGVGRSAITSFVYGVLEKNFRRAFALQLNYCFCKGAVSGRVMRRDRMAFEYRAATGEVRMIHHIVANSPRRGALIPRDAIDK